MVYLKKFNLLPNMFKNKKQFLIWASILQLINETKTDYLTGLPNRKSFDEDLIDQIIKIKKRQIFGFKLILIDLKNLKKINDNSGMKEGDKVILNMTKDLLDQSSDKEIKAFRIGGDEFAIIVNKKNKHSKNNFEISLLSVPAYKAEKELVQTDDIILLESTEIAEKIFYKVNKKIIELKRDAR